MSAAIRSMRPSKQETSKICNAAREHIRGARQIFVAVHRLHYTVFYARIGAEEYLPATTRSGMVCRSASRDPDTHENSSAIDRRTRVDARNLVRGLGELGWLCPRTQKREDDAMMQRQTKDYRI